MNNNEIGILVVDDELIVRESLSKWFAEEGYRVDVAENAAAALKKLQLNCWNIMFVDIRMPGMDGIELLHRVKETNKHIAVIVVTTNITIVRFSVSRYKVSTIASLDYFTTFLPF